MSVHVLSWVLRRSEARLGPRLVLIAMANYAGDDGRDAFMSVDTLVREARLSRRAVQAALRTLESDGAIRKIGVSQYGTTNYAIVMGGGEDDVAGGADSAPPGGADNDTGGAKKTTDSMSDSAPEPSSKPSRDPVDMSADRLFGEWRRLTGRSPATQFTTKRKTAVKARLREPAVGAELAPPGSPGWTREDDLLTAIRWVAGSKWHRENGHTELAVICRSPEQVEGYLQRAKADKGGAAASSTMGQYDKAIQ